MNKTPTATDPIIPVIEQHAYRLRGGTWINFGSKGCTVSDVLMVCAQEVGITDPDLMKQLKIAAAKLRSKEQ